MITIAEIMTNQVVALNPNNTAYDARQLMKTHNIRHIPVVDEANNLCGLVTQRDIFANATSSLDSEDATNQSIREQGISLATIMRTDVDTVRENTSLRQAAIHLNKYKFGCLPVVDDGRLVGIVTESDFVEVCITLLEQQEMVEPLGEFD